mmetsp:Transcript_621/g.1658  ORF Transcript_621/g.1658 Transcript_621/m.1658 type:complete len:554 (+) Transcript_621:89-1750(+)
MSKPRGAAARKCCWVGEACLPAVVVPKSSLLSGKPSARRASEIAITIPDRAPTGYSRCVAALPPPPPEMDRYGLWTISAETSRRDFVSQHRDDDELSVASTTGSIESARRCSLAWPDAPLSEIEEDAYKRRNLQGYIVRHKVIGKGNSGVVFAGERTVGEDTMQVAVKDVPLPAAEQDRAMLETEAKVHHHLRHPAIVRCYEVFFCANQDMFSSVMELMDAGSLLDVLRLGDHRIPINVLKGVAKQVLDALVYLHSVKRVIHRDVKPGNILMNRKGEVKLADFGVCSRPRDTRDSHCATWVGTVTYMSPERITGDQYSFNADVWAVGVLIVEAALGRYPYLLEGMDKARMEFWDLLEVVLHTNVSQMLPGEVDANFRSFAEYLLQNDHSLRPSASEALHHPFLAGVNDESMRVARWTESSIQDNWRYSDAVKIARGLGRLSVSGQEDVPSSSLNGGESRAGSHGSRGSANMGKERSRPGSGTSQESVSPRRASPVAAAGQRASPAPLEKHHSPLAGRTSPERHDKRTSPLGLRRPPMAPASILLRENPSLARP